MAPDTTYIRNIVVGCPEPPEALGTFYAHLLGWTVIRRDWFVIAPSADAFPRLAFGDGPGEYVAPVWGDPERPQQMHLDIAVPDLDAFEDHAISLGAVRLQDRGFYRTLSDPAGHPFDIFESEHEPVVAPTIAQIVIDCAEPASLASFYERFLSMTRTSDSPHWVEIAAEPGQPNLAFQLSSAPPPRWPDPKFPQQVHMDFHVESSSAAADLVVSLGATPLDPQGGSCPVFADPAGHPFCLCSEGQ